MKPVAIWLSDQSGTIHLKEVKPDSWLKQLLKRLKPVLFALLWATIGYIIGQIN